MIEFNDTVKALLEKDVIESFFMVKITSPNGTDLYSTTTYFRNITTSDGQLYEADGLLVSLDPPKLNSVVDREQYTITMADSDYAGGAYAEDGLVGYTVDVRLGFVDDDVPLLGIDDTLLIYRGVIDSVGYKINTEEHGEALLQFVCSSPMTKLNMRKYIYMSKDYIMNKHPDDTCCDQIYQGSGTIMLKWGKLTY